MSNRDGVYKQFLGEMTIDFTYTKSGQLRPRVSSSFLYPSPCSLFLTAHWEVSRTLRKEVLFADAAVFAECGESFRWKRSLLYRYGCIWYTAFQLKGVHDNRGSSNGAEGAVAGLFRWHKGSDLCA